MEDLLEIHYGRLKNNESSLCPAYWLRTHKARMQIEEVLYWDKELPVVIDGEPLDKGYKLKALHDVHPYREVLGQIIAHPKVALLYKASPIPNHKMEEGIRARVLFNNPDMSWEINTPVGRIDCMNNDEIIEIKAARNWKEGIGQLVSYGYYYPTHKLVLHLYGYLKSDRLESITKVAERVGIRVQTTC